jgi:hypothetical protein
MSLLALLLHASVKYNMCEFYVTNSHISAVDAIMFLLIHCTSLQPPSTHKAYAINNLNIQLQFSQNTFPLTYYMLQHKFSVKQNFTAYTRHVEKFLKSGLTK